MRKLKNLRAPLFLLTVFAFSCSPKSDTTDSEEEKKPATPPAKVIGRAPDSPEQTLGAGTAEPVPSETIPHALADSPAHKWADTIAQTPGEWMERYAGAGSPEEKRDVINSKMARGPEELAPLLKRALLDPATPVRVEAVQSTTMLTANDEIVDVLLAATYDTSEEVREQALDMVHETASIEARLEFFEQALEHVLPEIKQEALLELGRYSSKEAFQIMLQGLKDPDPAFRTTVNEHLEPFVQQESADRSFANYDEAQAWWNANQQRYDEHMTFME